MIEWNLCKQIACIAARRSLCGIALALDGGGNAAKYTLHPFGACGQHTAQPSGGFAVGALEAVDGYDATADFVAENDDVGVGGEQSFQFGGEVGASLGKLVAHIEVEVVENGFVMRIGGVVGHVIERFAVGA